MNNKRKKKRIAGIILGAELVIAVGILLLLVWKGEISFRMIGARETTSSTAYNKDGTKQPSSEDASQQEVVDNSKDQQSGPEAQNNGKLENEQDDIEKPQEENKGVEGNGVNPVMNEADEHEEAALPPEDVFDTITISAAGDVTLGRDLTYGYERSFDHELELQNMDYGYFFRNVKDIFEKDDITVVNLETTLTTAKKPAEKRFRFKADPSYVEILKQGSIETVSIANNHTKDYLEQGYQDTLTTLKNADIGYFGYEHKEIRDIRGIKVGFAGFVSWEVTDSQKNTIKNTIEELREDGAVIVIVMFHWGIETKNYPNTVQKELARHSIDSGADLVLGGHPHVLQGIEEYNGKSIVYSLGNFSFGGNKNPKDKDTMIYVHRFNMKNGELISQENEIIPCSISSVKERNNYQPTPLEDNEKKRVLDKIAKFSEF